MPSTPSNLDARGKPDLKRVGGFEILDLIGEGGMGAVYRAKQTSLERIVALKVLAPHLAANTGYIDSFIREARSAARLNHPNIIPVFDAGKADDVYYYAMEFVEGETLYKWVKREGALPEKMALEIGLCVANALRNAWEKEQLIHRDVKPENVMIDLRGNVKLCDLGLAKYFGENTLMSLSGQAFGTPNYMAPEQARAERTVDFRADIYALGMTLYHALTAQIPFHGGSAAMVMARHMTEQLADPREFSPDISTDTCRLLQRMLAKDANDRFQSWGEVIRELERLRNGDAFSFPPLAAGKSSLRLRNLSESTAPKSAPAAAATAPQSPQKTSTKPIAVAVVAALVVLLLLVGGAYYFFSQPPPIANNNNVVTPPPINPFPHPPLNPATEQWAQLKTFAAANPAALDELVKRLQKFLEDFPDAPEKADAAKLLAEVEAKQAAAAPKRTRPESIEAGLQFLASQQKENGSFGAKQVGVDALALRAFLVNGHLPNRDSEYRAVVEKALAFVLSQQTPDGQFNGGGGRMYGHGITTLMLAELYSATKDEQVRSALTKAIEVILKAQAVQKPPQHQGGLRYEATSRDSDMSVTCWQLAALVKAKEAGLPVPDAAIEDAILYVLRLAHANGGFGYMGPAQTPSTTAVAMATLLRAGERESPEVWKALDGFIKDPWRSNAWTYYTVYYGSLAMYQVGGKYWEMWRSTMEKMLPPLQKADGSFQLGGGTESAQGGVIYTTALMVLALSVAENKFPDLKLGTGEPPTTLVSRAARKQKEIAEFAAANPDATDALKQKYEEFLRVFPNTPETPAIRAALNELSQREARAKAQAREAFGDLSQQVLAAFAARKYDDAVKLADAARDNPTLAPESQRVTIARDAAMRLKNFWTAMPRDFARLVGKTVTAQNTSGKVAEVSGDEIVLEIAANAMVGISIAQLTTSEVVALGIEAFGEDDAAALLNLAWFAFAEGNLRLCDQLLDRAQRNGGDAVTAREQMAALSSASFEFEAEKTYNEILALIAAKRWVEAQEKVRVFKQRFASTKTFAAAQAMLAQWEIALPLEVAAAKKAGNLVHTLSGHDNAVTSVAVSPDGRTVLTASFDKSVRLWDFVTGRELRVLGNHNDAARGAAFTPDGRAVVSAGHDTTVRVWNVAGGEIVSKRFGQRTLTCLAVSSDGKRAAVGEDYATVRLVEIAAATQVRQFNVGGSGIVSVDFSSDGKYLLVGAEFGTLHLMDLAAGKEARSWRAFGGPAFAVFSPDARFIAGGGAGGKMFALWETESGKEVRQFQGHTDNVRCVAFSRDGKFLLSGGNDRTVRLWDVATGRLLKTFEGHTGAVRSVAFSADGRFGVSASDDRTAKIWKLEGDGGAAAPAPAGPLVATWQGHTAPVNCLALSPDGRTVVSGSYDNTVRLWDVVTGMEIKQFRGHEKGVRGVSFSADGKFIVSAGEDNLCKIWDVASGREARGIGSTNRWMLHASFSPDGKRLATATAGGAVRVWDNWLTATDPKSGKEFRGFTSPVYTVLFTPDGKHLLAASESGNAKLFDSDSAAELQNFRGQGGMYCAAMSADGKFVIAGSNSRSFKLWETASGREVRQFDGHADIVRALAFSRDGRFILSCADDKTVRLWETASGRLIKTFEGHTDKVRGVTFTADGRFGISGSADNTLKVWRLWDTDAPPQAAAPARPPMSELEEQIRYYVGNMGHPDVSKRIEASRELKKIGKPALPFLQPLTEDRDHSVRVAAAVLIATMREDDKPDATFPAGFGVKQTDRGLEIVAVTPNSAAEKIGLQRGDLITRFNNHEVKSAAQLQSSLAPDNINVSQSVLEVSRDGKPLNFQIPRR